MKHFLLKAKKPIKIHLAFGTSFIYFRLQRELFLFLHFHFCLFTLHKLLFLPLFFRAGMKIHVDPLHLLFTLFYSPSKRKKRRCLRRIKYSLLFLPCVSPVAFWEKLDTWRTEKVKMSRGIKSHIVIATSHHREWEITCFIILFIRYTSGGVEEPKKKL